MDFTRRSRECFEPMVTFMGLQSVYLIFSLFLCHLKNFLLHARKSLTCRLKNNS